MKTWNPLARPVPLQRLEGGVLLVAAVLAYYARGGNWLLFALLLLAPDVGMLGYLAGPQVGATVYNLAHTYVLPGALALAGMLTGNGLMVALALIWFAHIGMDRLFAYGLKYPDAFKHTHLS
jgi:hypothetical protein